ncbi:MAG: Cytochrome c oxidase subunit CcoP [Myxococcaceae bacterium]|nr:Cytochrome c oxidase subunit CcoP [Myxococcaceae bacterium]
MSSSHKHDPIQGEIIHEYDGIQEADNQLPNWWLGTLFGAIVFSIGYWFYYQEFRVAPGLAQAYYAEQAERAEKTGVDPSEAELMAALDSPALALGRQTFTSTCVPCHEAEGQGKIGPNLTDSAWLHGGGPVAIFRTIRDGVPAKGMPSWGPSLGRAGVTQLTAFVLSLRNKNVPGKAPEGAVYDLAAAPPTAAPAGVDPAAPEVSSGSAAPAAK